MSATNPLATLLFFFFFQTLCTFAYVYVEGGLKRREGKVYSRAGVMANKPRTHARVSNRSDGKRKERPPLLLEDKQGSSPPDK